MNAYRNRWIEVLKDQQFAGWHIDIHGQAIVIKISDESLESVEKEMPDLINKLVATVGMPAEWLKFIFYNDKLLFQYILNPELKDQR